MTTQPVRRNRRGERPSMRGRSIRSRSTIACAGAALPANLIESLEARVLLAGYTLSSIPLGTNDTGLYPLSNLVADAIGNLYGSTNGGGPSDGGTVFEIPRGTAALQTLVSFDGTNGAGPGQLTVDASGNIFGTTGEGGPAGYGNVFEIPHGRHTLQILAWLDKTSNTSGAAVVPDAHGNLYGTSGGGGAFGDGSVFELPHGTATVQTLASFDGENGSGPDGPLALDASGDLYGTTFAGGPVDDGTVFKIAHDTTTIQTRATFDKTNGAEPSGGLILDADGNLYGTSRQGGVSDIGTVFEIPRDTGTIRTLASFNGADSSPSAVTRDAAGDLYGTTAGGGPTNFGTIFELPRSSGTIQTLATFNNPTGGNSGLTLDADGNLYGTTSGNYGLGYGTVFELPRDGGTIETLVTFANPNGIGPTGGLTFDNSGDLFGTTFRGGSFDAGTVFEIPHGTSAIQTVASFNRDNGSAPSGGVALDAEGNVYGVTQVGGAHGLGTVFVIDHGSGTIQTLASFDNVDGAGPVAGVTLDAQGNIYGTTFNGGASTGTTVFEIPRGSGAIQTLVSFNGANGNVPVGPLTLDADGNIYGTTQIGGPSLVGTVFEIVRSTGTMQILASGGAAGHPSGGVTLDAQGNLYGTTYDGGSSHVGSVFEIVRNTGAVLTLVSFNETNAGGPAGSLALDAAGNLYGTAVGGGAFGDGTVFEIPRGTGTIQTLVSFNNNNGANPAAGVVLDSDGNLYGTTGGGGPHNSGGVFKLSLPIHVVVSFSGGNGAQLYGGATFDNAGNLLGTTWAGGASGLGTVFEIAHGSKTTQTLASFDKADGAHPGAGVILDAQGNLFGTTNEGGASNLGTVFKMAYGTNTIQTIASFDGADGAHPFAALTLDAAGNLFGTTFDGGKSGYGTIFEIPHDTSTIQTIASFKNTDGANPSAAVALDPSGNLYGTTRNGGPSGVGTVFEIPHRTGTIQTLASFNWTSGAFPYDDLTLDGSGNLYGTTAYGGAAGKGTVFEIAHGTKILQTIASFHGDDGAYPLAGVRLDDNGNLYGTTSGGGSSGVGTVFEIPRDTGTIQTLGWFNGTNGRTPWAAVTLDGSGNLYGATYGGGTSDLGTVFRLLLSLPGDINGDGKVDFSDLLIVARNYGKSGTPAQGDLNGDGSVGFDDLVILARNYGHSLPQPARATLLAALTSTASDDSLSPLLRRRRPR